MGIPSDVAPLTPQAMGVTERWQFTTAGQIHATSPSLVDINWDGVLEVLIGSRGGYLYCLNYTTGEQVWNCSIGHDIVESSPCVADLDGDRTPEILVGAGSWLYCINHTGGVEWAYGTGSSPQTPCVADLEGDGILEILVGSWGTDSLYCLNYTGVKESGVEEWIYQADDNINYSPAVADLDEDGTLEVLVGSRDTYLHCVNHTGGREWRYMTAGEINSSPAVADLTGDGDLEILVG